MSRWSIFRKKPEEEQRIAELKSHDPEQARHFRKKGFDATQIEEIAERTCVSRNGLRPFSSRDALLLALANLCVHVLAVWVCACAGSRAATIVPTHPRLGMVSPGRGRW